MGALGVRRGPKWSKMMSKIMDFDHFWMFGYPEITEFRGFRGDPIMEISAHYLHDGVYIRA